MKKNFQTFTQTLKIYSQDIGMEFVIGKCATLIMKRGKRETTENFKKSERLEKGKLLVLGNIRCGNHQTRRDGRKKRKKKKKVPQENEKNQLCSRNFIKGVSTLAVILVKYSGLFLNWMREELKLTNGQES